MFNKDWFHITDFYEWMSNQTNAIWHDILNILTNNSPGTPGASQEELALIIVMLFVSLLTNIVISGGMLRRGPALFLDKSLLIREIAFGLLFGVTLWAFYTVNSIPPWVRISLYASIAISGILVILSIARENSMSASEVEQERYEYLERKEHGN